MKRMNGKDAVDFAGRADAEKTELELSGLDPDALGFMRAGERKKSWNGPAWIRLNMTFKKENPLANVL